MVIHFTCKVHSTHSILPIYILPGSSMVQRVAKICLARLISVSLCARQLLQPDETLPVEHLSPLFGGDCLPANGFFIYGTRCTNDDRLCYDLFYHAMLGLRPRQRHRGVARAQPMADI